MRKDIQKFQLKILLFLLGTSNDAIQGCEGKEERGDGDVLPFDDAATYCEDELCIVSIARLKQVLHQSPEPFTVCYLRGQQGICRLGIGCDNSDCICGC